MDNNCQYEEFHGSYLKVDGGNPPDRLKGISRLAKAQGSFKGIKECKNSVEEKTQENPRKSGFQWLTPSVSFNDKILNLPSKKLPTIFRLSFKRRSCDVEEATELGKC